MKENTTIMPHYTRNWLMLGALNNILIINEHNDEQRKALIAQGDEHFKRATELSPKRQEVILEWIKKDLVSKDHQKAGEKAVRCIQLNPSIADCYWFKGLTEIYENNLEQSKADFKKAEELGFTPDDVTYLSQLAEAYNYIENYEELVKVYETLIVYRGDVPQYHSSLAFLYQKFGRYEDSYEEAMKFLFWMPSAKEETLQFLQTLPPQYHSIAPWVQEKLDEQGKRE